VGATGIEEKEEEEEENVRKYKNRFPGRRGLFLPRWHCYFFYEVTGGTNNPES
jgi:hypothetical protein